MIVFHLVVTLLMSAVTALPLAVGRPENAVQLRNDPEVRIGKLDNGMTYYIRHHDNPAGLADFHIVHNVGAIQEEDSQAGLAHFIEHMAFNGTANLPGRMLVEYLESVGVKYGPNLNANTSMEVTTYKISQLPVGRETVVDSALLILHDWSRFMTLDDEAIDKERGVIIEELRMRNNASLRTRAVTMPALFGGTRYGYRNIIGSEEQLRTFDRRELRDFYERWYRPDLQAVVIVGDFDTGQMEAKVRKVMGSIPAVANPVPKQYFPIPDNEEPVVAVATDPGLTKSTVLLYIKHLATPREMNSGRETIRSKMMIAAALSIMNARLGDMPQQPELLSRAGMGYNRLSVLNDALSIGADVHGDTILPAFEALYTELERLRRHGITQQELQDYKTRTLAAMTAGNARSGERLSSDYANMCIDNFVNNSPILTSADNYEMSTEIVSSFEVEQIDAMLQEMITERNNVLLVTVPQKVGIVAPTRDELLDVMRRVRAMEIGKYDYTSPDEPLIAPEAAAAIEAGRVEHEQAGIYGSTVWTLGNGMRVVVLPTDFGAGNVSLNGRADGGVSTVDDTEYPAAQVLARMIGNSGAGGFTQERLEKILSTKSVSVMPSLGRFSLGFSGNAPTKEIEMMFQAVYLCFTAPRLNRKDFDAEANRLHTRQSEDKRTPDVEFRHRLDSVMYGDSPHRRTGAGDNVDFDTILALHDRFFGRAAGNYTFCIVGDFVPEQIKPLVEKYLGGLPAGAPALTWRDDMATVRRGRATERFAVPMSVPKSRVHYHWSGDVAYTQENTMLMELLASCLGKRYVESIREEKSGAYIVNVVGSVGRQPRPGYTLSVSFQTDPALVDELAAAVEAGLQEIADNGPLAEDMAGTIRYWLKIRPETQRQNGTWAGYLQNYYTWHETWNDTWEETLRGLTGEKVRAMAQKILDDGNMIKVIMDPKR